jgi:hypothetical protein
VVEGHWRSHLVMALFRMRCYPARECNSTSGHTRNIPMNPWLVNPPWQNFSSMYRESIAAEEARSEVERRHHMTAGLYFGMASLEAFLNQKKRNFLAPRKPEDALLRALRYTSLMDKVRKWPSEIIGKPVQLAPAIDAQIENFNDLRASVTHAKTPGQEVYRTLESLTPTNLVDVITEYVVRYHEAEGTRYPYWVFGWNYLNPDNQGHEIILLNDQQFFSSLRAFGVQSQGGFALDERWKNQVLGTHTGYLQIRDLLRARSKCEPKSSEFPFQPKLCRRWWTHDHQTTCGALIRE